MSPATVFVGGQVFDGLSDDVITDAAIHVADGRIGWVGQRAELPPRLSDGAEVIDLANAFVMPGMIDAHVHLQAPLKGKGDVQLAFVEFVEFTVMKAAYNAQVYLASGFTSVMDAGCRGNVAVGVRDAVEAGIALGPRIVASGPPISPTAGLADEFLPFIHHDIVQGVVADSIDALRVAVRTQVKEGVDNVKIGVSGSAFKRNSNPYVSDMSAEAISAVVAEAHRAGCSVAAHCHPARGFIDCLSSEVDTIHHGFHIDESCLEPFARSTKTYLVPTVWKLRGTIEGAEAMGRSPDLMRSYAETSEGFYHLIGKLIQGGMAGRIAVGSDAGHGTRHGGTARELSILVELGMTPAQAIRSATSVAADAVGLGTVTGSIKEGMAADFVVVDGDPLDDIRVLEDHQRLAGVYKDGALVATRGSVVGRLDTSRPFPAYQMSGRRHRGRLTVSK